jgi:hypothetical protein
MAREFNMSRKHRALGLPVVVFLAVSGLLFVSMSSLRHQSAEAAARVDSPATRNAGAAAQDSDIRGAVEQALRTHQTLAVPHRAQPGAGVNPTEADFRRQKEEGTAAVHAIFGDTPAAKEIAALDKAIAMQRSGQFRVLAGGIKNLSFASIDVNPDGTTATVHATVETWSKISLKNPDGSWHDADPHNTLQITVTLTRSDLTKWVVRAFDWAFAPGAGP